MSLSVHNDEVSQTEYIIILLLVLIQMDYCPVELGEQ